jgi:hypothetical protein
MIRDPLVVGAIESLAGENRAAFFARLIHNLSISARANYPATEADNAQSIERLKGLNEVLHVIGNHLLREAGISGVSSSDDESFINAVLQKATVHGCAADVRWVIQKASR